jgi:dipeptidyl aminopeptidase/acylaminoacyl peptidase
MQFTDLCIEKYPAIDSSRLGVTGGSYGGFLTNWIIGHTDRFKAAVSLRSVSNWLSFAGLSDIGISYGEDQMDADIWSNPEKMWCILRCAMRISHNAQLFIHSDQDTAATFRRLSDVYCLKTIWRRYPHVCVPR